MAGGQGGTETGRCGGAQGAQQGEGKGGQHRGHRLRRTGWGGKARPKPGVGVFMTHYLFPRLHEMP